MRTTPETPARVSAPPVVRYGDGEPFPGTPFVEIIPADLTDGRVVVLSAAMPPGVRVDAHVHDAEDQITVVIDGVVRCRLGDEERVIEAGGAVFLPRGVPHELWNDGPGVARMLELYTPGGFEQVLRDGGRARAAG